MRTHKKTAIALIITMITSPMMAMAQTPPPASPDASTAVPDKPPLTDEELEQLVAPIALYPDSLLSQVLMASTYPLEIVQADRFAKANPDLKGDALTAALESQSWDPSVKSLVNFPTVLSMMSDKLDSTVKLGDAFIEDGDRVMATVQTLRAKAQAQGNLPTTPQQIVTVVQQPATQVQVITIAPANPQIIYVPTYNPVVVYGPWPYPAYPPYYWRPPGYVAVGVVGFGVGFACGAAWGYAWGSCNWNNNKVNININQNININKNINRNNYQKQFPNNGARQNGQGTFQHNPAHREGVAYRDQATAQKYGGASSAKAVQARDAYRGRTDTGGQNLGASGAGSSLQNRPNTGQAGAGLQNRPNTGQAGTGIQNRPNAGQSPSAGQPGAGMQNRPSAGQSGVGQSRPSSQSRPASSGAGAFNDVGGGRGAAQSASQRGAASRSGGGGGGGAGRAGGSGRK